jgi:hypothetical protein
MFSSTPSDRPQQGGVESPFLDQVFAKLTRAEEVGVVGCFHLRHWRVKDSL